MNVKKIGIHILILTALLPNIYSQTTALFVGTEIVCPNEEVLVPINVTDFNDIGAFTLFIGYDTAVLSFTEHLNENPETQGIYSNAMVSPTTQIGISWSSLNPANITSGKLVDLKFNYNIDNCPLTFNPGCELVNSSLVVIEFTTSDGQILQSEPIITENPSPVNADEGDDVNFTVSATGVTSYQWQKSEDQGLSWNDLVENAQYVGVNTQVLNINDVSYEMNGTQYRCKICHETCCIYSEPAFLTVNQLSVISFYDNSVNGLITVSPNPFMSEIEIKFNVNLEGRFIVNLVNCQGQVYSVTDQTTDPGDNAFTFETKNLKSGLYLCYCEFIHNQQRSFYIQKLIKNGIDNW
jgi:hypothetical protein